MPKGKAGSAADIADIMRQEQQLRPLAGAEVKGKKKKKKGALARLARLAKMAAMGSRYKTEWKPPERFREKEKGFTTVRTKAVTGELKKAGLTDEEIRRLRGG